MKSIEERYNEKREELMKKYPDCRILVEEEWKFLTEMSDYANNQLPHEIELEKRIEELEKLKKKIKNI